MTCYEFTTPYFMTLTHGHPAPWSITYFPRGPYHTRTHVCDILDSKGEKVFHKETHSGDGDMIYLDDWHLEELVRMINLEYEKHYVQSK